MKLFFFIFFIFSFNLWSSEEEIKEYEKIQDVIRNDLLEKEFNEQKKILSLKKQQVKKKVIDKNLFPKQGDLWGIVSEWWLVKNAHQLKWDQDGPDYGISESFHSLLESMGFYNKKIKILLLNSSSLTHFALPGQEGEVIFLLSRQFIRALDLSKLEIALVLLEDFFRIHFQFLTQDLENQPSLGLKVKFGASLKKENIDKTFLEKLIQSFNDFITQKGFSFEQQFQVTTHIAKLIGDKSILMEAYLSMLKKRDILVKTNENYKNYAQIFPSPEIQLRWLNQKPPL
jgi:hypothetical protein